MLRSDLAGVLAVADGVHPAFPEEPRVFEERLRLYPAGCLVFAGHRGVAAYALGHPWYAYSAPALNTLLGALPRNPETWYIHDLALLPRLRGGGIAAAGVRRILERASRDRVATVSLVAVNGSAGFWQRHGFRPVADRALAQRMHGYGEAAVFMTRTLIVD